MGQNLSPFFVVNPKQYLYGKESLNLALQIDKICKKTGITIFFTCPFTDMKTISKQTQYLTLCSQTMDSILPGRGMGHILPEALVDAGVKATFLNHAENPKSIEEIGDCIKRADDLKLITIVCADTIEEGEQIAALHPTIVLVEPTELIGTGRIVDKEFVRKANERIRKIDSSVKVMIASGVSKPEDCYQMISYGADGTGATSGILNAKDPVEQVEKMVNAVITAWKNRQA